MPKTKLTTLFVGVVAGVLLLYVYKWEELERTVCWPKGVAGPPLKAAVAWQSSKSNYEHLTHRTFADIRKPSPNSSVLLEAHMFTQTSLSDLTVYKSSESGIKIRSEHRPIPSVRRDQMPKVGKIRKQSGSTRYASPTKRATQPQHTYLTPTKYYEYTPPPELIPLPVMHSPNGEGSNTSKTDELAVAHSAQKIVDTTSTMPWTTKRDVLTIVPETPGEIVAAEVSETLTFVTPLPPNQYLEIPNVGALNETPEPMIRSQTSRGGGFLDAVLPGLEKVSAREITPDNEDATRSPLTPVVGAIRKPTYEPMMVPPKVFTLDAFLQDETRTSLEPSDPGSPPSPTTLLKGVSVKRILTQKSLPFAESTKRPRRIAPRESGDFSLANENQTSESVPKVISFSNVISKMKQNIVQGPRPSVTTLPGTSMDPEVHDMFSANSTDSIAWRKEVLNQLAQQGAIYRGSFRQLLKHAYPPLDWTIDVSSQNSNEARHVVFVKVHKAASTTLFNVFVRFATSRQLNVLFPDADENVLSEYRADTLHRLAPYPPTPPFYFDVLCNHVVFNQTLIRPLFPDDTKYIAIVREPFSQIASAYSYFQRMKRVPYVLKSSSFSDFILNQQKYEPSDVLSSFTNNRMSIDLGLLASQVSNHSFISPFLAHLHSLFHLVLIADRFDESMVLLRRTLRWTMKDVLYARLNTRTPQGSNNISQSEHQTNSSSKTETEILWNPVLRAKFREFAHFDIALYQYFSRVFDDKVKSEGRDFAAEVKSYRMIQDAVQRFCNENKEDTDRKKSSNCESRPTSVREAMLSVSSSSSLSSSDKMEEVAVSVVGDSLNVEATRWSPGFTLPRLQCKTLQMEERDILRSAKYWQVKRLFHS